MRLQTRAAAAAAEDKKAAAAAIAEAAAMGGGTPPRIRMRRSRAEAAAAEAKAAEAAYAAAIPELGGIARRDRRARIRKEVALVLEDRAVPLSPLLRQLPAEVVVPLAALSAQQISTLSSLGEACGPPTRSGPTTEDDAEAEAEMGAEAETAVEAEVGTAGMTKAHARRLVISVASGVLAAAALKARSGLKESPGPTPTVQAVESPLPLVSGTPPTADALSRHGEARADACAEALPPAPSPPTSPPPRCLHFQAVFDAAQMSETVRAAEEVMLTSRPHMWKRRHRRLYGW